MSELMYGPLVANLPGLKEPLTNLSLRQLAKVKDCMATLALNDNGIIMPTDQELCFQTLFSNMRSCWIINNYYFYYKNYIKYILNIKNYNIFFWWCLLSMLDCYFIVKTASYTLHRNKHRLFELNISLWYSLWGKVVWLWYLICSKIICLILKSAK